MLQYKCVEGQSLLDICLQTYGSFDYLLKLIEDNGFANVNDSPYSGQVITWDETLTVDKAVFQTSQNGQIIYATKYLQNNPVKTVVSGNSGKIIAGSNNAGEQGGAVIPSGVFPVYIGFVDAINPSPDNILAMTERMVPKSSQDFIYTINSKYPCYSYPAFYGALSSIKDTNGFEIKSGFTKTNVNILVNGELVIYSVYTLTRPTTQADFKITFIP